MVCKTCGTEIPFGEGACPSCGMSVVRSPYKRDLVLLLSFLGLLGIAGAHRFYTGRIMSGLIWFVTGGLCGFGTLYDLYQIFTNKFEDGEGRLVLP